jgi:hypothetical protein
MNLASLTEDNQIEGLLIFQSGFDTMTGIYYPGDSIPITLSKNNLQGGYCGNTLLRKINPTGKRAEFDIRINQFLFSKCSIEVKINQTLYGLSRKNGYLRLKAKIKGLK